MRQIQGDAKSVRDLLAGAKYAIDYYQREYRWGAKQVEELIQDLTGKFLESHDDGNERAAVENYGHYFLGSLILSVKDGHKFIIDGQQRLTTLTLMLIYMHHNLADDDQKSQLSDLIFSRKYGRRSFNLDVPERTACMEDLFTKGAFDETDQSESVVNIVRRYQDIEELFPDDLSGATLPYFADWMIENVHLVEITAYTDADAYTIFETMNDRGLSLTPTDMLKGYLLANITDESLRNRASQVWRKRVSSLKDIAKEEDADAIKAWLRSQHAQTIRERKRGAQPRDFDLIGTEFHRWVRDHEEDLQLHGSARFADFIRDEFDFYARWYRRVREAAEALTPSLEPIHYNAQNNFTLQYPLLLAPLRREDAEDAILRKLRVVASYIDILIARRIWNYRSIGYSTMQYAMFLVIREIRGKSVEDLVSILAGRLDAEQEQFAARTGFGLHGMNGSHIHRLLARMTVYIETHSGRAPRYTEYVQRHGRNGYEVEHVWANHPERHSDEFQHPTDFLAYRNRIGGLLLLPKTFNASFGDLPYREKREHYLKQNLLAQSLHENAYERDPGFSRFVKDSDLLFRPHREFKKADLDDRQNLYLQLVERVWDPARLEAEAQR